jgi:hypothetical protein
MRRLIATGTIVAGLAGTVLAVASAAGSPGGSVIRLYEHDTSRSSIDLGDSGDSAGDQFLFAGDTFKRKGDAKVGRAAGVCTTVSTGDAGEVICAVNFSLRGGQIATQGLFVAADLFGGKTVSFPITGGTGRYRLARGDATVEVPRDVPNLADANFVLNVR